MGDAELRQRLEQAGHCFASQDHTLFVGRGMQCPVAREGALKLKEISSIHVEAYPTGELKHGPLALVSEAMPVVILAPTTGCWPRSWPIRGADALR